jgi:tRNA A-37 threonylcarbamoyl transferase component Bud32
MHFEGVWVFMNYGRYQIIKELGGGSMGVVYLAHDPQIGRDAALKVFRQDRVTNQALLERFRREAKAIGLLSHPNIVTVYDVGEDHGTIFIVMEFVEGKALSELIDEKRLTREETVDLGIQVAEALDYAHEKGIVHRDIKPSNIIVQPDGQVKITDFGIARLEDPAMTKYTQPGEVLGTPAYMSPEQALGDEVDRRTDLFSLGIILYELIVGRRPFGGKTLASVLTAIVQEEPPEPSTFVPDLQQEFSQIITKCLKKRPDERYHTGKQLAEALRTLESKEPPKAVTPSASVEKRKWPFFLMAFILMVAVVGGIVYLYMKRPSELSVMVQSEPEGAQVYVDEALKGETPLPLKLERGAYRVRIIKTGYHSWEEEISLEKGRTEPLIITLAPILAILPLETSPPGARVYVDGDYKGETGDVPLKLELPLGAHQVRVMKDGHRTWEDRVELSEEKAYPLKVVALPRELATLQIESSPSSADVYVGDIRRGKTPISLEFPLGDYRIRLMKEGFGPWENVVKLREQRQYPLKVKMPRELARLQIRSTPPSADVSIGGSQRGKTPISLELPLGNYDILCSKEGYHPWEATVRLEEPRPPAVNIRLQPIIVFLQVDSKPSGAEVYVDGELRGETPAKVEVSRATHRLRLKKPGHKEWEKPVDLSNLEEKEWFCMAVDLKTGWSHAYACDQ